MTNDALRALEKIKSDVDGLFPKHTHGERFETIRAALTPVDVEGLKDMIDEATSIFEHIIDDLRDNQDLSHLDFRIKVSEMAHDYLSHNHIRHLAARGCFGVPEGYALVPDDCRKADIDSGALDGFKGDLNDAYHNIQNYINWAKAAPKKEEV